MPRKKTPKGKHFDQGKPPVHLIPSEAIIGIAKALDFGAKKYGEYNFRLGMKHTKIIDSLLRHTLAYLSGEDNDPESGLSHIHHLGANYAMLEYIRLHHPELDDRFKGNKNAIKSKTPKSRNKTSKLRN